MKEGEAGRLAPRCYLKAANNKKIQGQNIYKRTGMGYLNNSNSKSTQEFPHGPGHGMRGNSNSSLGPERGAEDG